MAKNEQRDNKWEKFAEQQPDDSDEQVSEQDLQDALEEQSVGGIDYPSHDKLEQDLTAIEMERDSLKDKLYRAQAEMENLMRRSERDISKALKYGSEKLLTDLLPVVDSMIRGLEAPESDDPHAKAMREGVQLTLDLLEKTLQKHGVVVIDPQVGEKFDPEKHEAMSMQQHPGVEPNSVLQVLQKGFELNGRVVRAAMVIVNQA